jgi:hypothetical protein
MAADDRADLIAATLPPVQPIISTLATDSLRLIAL